MAFRLKLREPLPEGLKRVFREEIDSAFHMCQHPAKERGVTVHEVRKHLKKLRAAMRLAIGQVGKNCHAQEDRCVREIGRLVSDLRDAQVRLQTFIELRNKASKKKGTTPISAQPGVVVARTGKFFRGVRRLAKPGNSAIRRRQSASDGVAAGWSELETSLRRSVQNLQARTARTRQNDR